ncbi:prenylated Rab acceptor protein 1 isoform X2 [Meriones unguiculatus]|uniref:prenylated Rab acceptor protein 1 isoform X2 n=1 Tax=Meriones unguiculatus TaxID=10047 RepID=UPI00293E63C0|nr:prenylated Rab acceptor protein 1 isoform X2 [Meriones unguiculatus]
MAAQKDQQKDAEAEGLSATTLLPKLIPSAAGREWLERRRATIRPWGAFVDQQRFSRPRNLGELCQRLVRNVEYYQSNYVFVFLGLILYCVPGGEPRPSVRPGWWRLFPLLLAGRGWLRRLLGPGSHSSGHRLPRRLPPDGAFGRRRAANGACVKRHSGPACLARPPSDRVLPGLAPPLRVSTNSLKPRERPLSLEIKLLQLILGRYSPGILSLLDL